MISHTNLHLPGTAQGRGACSVAALPAHLYILGIESLLFHFISVEAGLVFVSLVISVEAGSENVYTPCLPSLVLLVLPADIFRA
jgi:hypothetical protein